MRCVQIICKCGQLVDVVDKTIAAHQLTADGELCGRSGARYAPSSRSPRGRMISPDGIPMELIAAAELPCPECESHSIGVAAIFREMPKAKGECPEWVN